MIKEYTLANIHWLIAKDPWVQDIFESAGVQFDIQAQRIIDIYNSNDFERLSLKYIRMYERMLGITSDDTKTLADRRAYIGAMWKKSVPPTKEAIQSVCDGWMNGECEVECGVGYIEITFNSEIGVPIDLASLQAALLDVVPAHLGIRYNLKYLLIRDVHEVMTLTEIEETPMSHFAG